MFTNVSNTMVAKTVAFVAGLALVLTSFAPAASAQTSASVQAQIQALLTQVAALQAQMNGGSASVAPFTRDLTNGSSGGDVTSLQNWLIKNGYAIPAGATGYFGAQTQAALARYQAANAISPAAGYFGPLTRANVNAKLVVTPAPTPDTDEDEDDDEDDDRDELRGGEADLTDFELTREQSTGAEAEEEVEVATTEFDVEDGDVRVERLELIASAVSTSASVQPWRYFDRVVIMADDDEIADMDVDERSDWREVRRGVYRLNLTNLDYIVREGDRAEMTIAFDIASNIGSDNLDQEFDFYVSDRGIRALDAAGIQQYVGDDSETVRFGFGEEESGDLRIRTSDDDPVASTLISNENRESSEYTVFVFDIENTDDVDSQILDLAIGVDVGSTTIDADDVIRRATLKVGRESFDGDISADRIEFDRLDVELDGDDTTTFELVIRLARNAPNTTLVFDVANADVEAEGVRSGDDSSVSGSAVSEEHTVARDGIMATADRSDNRSDSDTNNDRTLGTFRVTFTVQALEEDAFIYRGAAQGGEAAGGSSFDGVASTTGFAYNVIANNLATTTTVNSATVQSGARLSGDFYRVRAGTSEEFTITVTVDPSVSGTYYVELDAIRFDDVNDGSTLNDNLYSVPDRIEFESEAESLIA